MVYKINTYINNDDNSARFVLGYDNTNPLIVIGVNPSIADDKIPDATMRRVLGYIQRNELNGFLMLNVYPQRATNPNCLPQKCDELLHKQNLVHVEKVFQTHPNATFLVAFGDTILKRPYLIQCFVDITKTILKYDPQWKHIGNFTAKGNPRHPSRGSYQELKGLDILKYLKLK
jgi:serine/threonine protein phosphatase 1